MNPLTTRQMKSLIRWAKNENILTFKANGLEVTFHPSVAAPKADAAKEAELLKLFQAKTKEEQAKEDEDLLYASVR